MTQYVFGTGQLYSMAVGGGAPLRWGALQDVSVDFSGDIKQLHGQYQFALDTARGKSKIDWKASSANIDVNAFNQMYFGQTTGVTTTGTELIQQTEAAAVPASTPWTVTATKGANFKMDLGVTFAATGQPLKQVASAPATGQYSVSIAGVYTFATADAGKAVILNYLWESASTGGSLEIENTLMGAAPAFQLVLTQTYKQKNFTLILYSCTAEKLSLPLKQDDYLIGEVSGGANANDANKIGRITTTSVVGGGS